MFYIKHVAKHGPIHFYLSFLLKQLLMKIKIKKTNHVLLAYQSFLEECKIYETQNQKNASKGNRFCALPSPVEPR